MSIDDKIQETFNNKPEIDMSVEDNTPNNKEREYKPAKNNNINEHVLTKDELKQAIKESRTHYPNEWLDFYKRVIQSKKGVGTYKRDKIVRGKFTINDNHQPELLADVPLPDDINSVFTMNWLPDQKHANNDIINKENDNLDFSFLED